MNGGKQTLAKQNKTSQQSWWQRGLLAALLFSVAFVPISRAEKDENERFKDVEVRVIRPKYFQKAKRFELGAQLTSIMNETFVYSFLATGIASYHFSESLALEMFLSYGFNIDKEDKRVLFSEFDIRTKIFRTTYQVGGVLQYTPIYGKWQLPSGRLVYFDTYFSFGGGMTGVTYKYNDFCTASTKQGANPIPTDVTKPYPTFIVGLGQRYFLDKKTAVKWDIRGNLYFYNNLDAECDPITSTATGSAQNNNITLQLGMTKFF